MKLCCQSREGYFSSAWPVACLIRLVYLLSLVLSSMPWVGIIRGSFWHFWISDSLETSRFGSSPNDYWLLFTTRIGKECNGKPFFRLPPLAFFLPFTQRLIRQCSVEAPCFIFIPNIFSFVTNHDTLQSFVPAFYSLIQDICCFSTYSKLPDVVTLLETI